MAVSRSNVVRNLIKEENIKPLPTKPKKRKKRTRKKIVWPIKIKRS